MNGSAFNPTVLLSESGYDTDVVNAYVEKYGRAPMFQTKKNNRVLIVVGGTNLWSTFRIE